jgi:hypothetical protein
VGDKTGIGWTEATWNPVTRARSYFGGLRSLPNTYPAGNLLYPQAF